MGRLRDGNLLSSGDESHEIQRYRDFYLRQGCVPVINRHNYQSLEMWQLSSLAFILFAKNFSSKETSIFCLL